MKVEMMQPVCPSLSLYSSHTTSWLGIVVMMVFLFVVLVVILNILIAQLSDTYADVKSDATRTLERNWAKALSAMEQANKFKVGRQQTASDMVYEDGKKVSGQLPKSQI